MSVLLKSVACLILFLAKSKIVKADELNLSAELQSNEEYDAFLRMALFEKINMMIIELKNITEHFDELTERQYNQKRFIRHHIDALKLSLQDVVNQHEAKTENLVTEVRQQITSSFDGQKDFLKSSLLSAESMKQYEANMFKCNRKWQTILRRQDGSLSFDRSWLEYKTGFGNINGNFFIGLESLHAITTYSEPQELLIVLQDFDNNTRYAKYADFMIGSESEKYKILKLGNYQGDAGDSFTQHVGFNFSTYDQDNDNTTMNHCAKKYQGGWWFSNCFSSHLTGAYLYRPMIGNDSAKGLIWYAWHGLKISLKYVEMMIRAK